MVWMYSTFLPFCLLSHSGLSSPSIPTACVSQPKALVSSELIMWLWLPVHIWAESTDNCKGRRRLEGIAEQVERGMDVGRFMLQFGTELCLSERKIKNKSPWLNGLVNASIKIKMRCATTVFSHRILQQVFSNNIPHHMISFSRQRNEVFLPRICRTFSPMAAKLSHKLRFFLHSPCSRRSHLKW